MIELQRYSKGLVSRKDGLFKLPFPGYVSIRLLLSTLGYTWFDAFLDMTTGATPFVQFKIITVNENYD
jgi:hypothetical protein